MIGAAIDNGFGMVGQGIKALVIIGACAGALAVLVVCSPLILFAFIAARLGIVK